jgi:hypothetical protein
MKLIMVSTRAKRAGMVGRCMLTDSVKQVDLTQRWGRTERARAR